MKTLLELRLLEQVLIVDGREHIQPQSLQFKDASGKWQNVPVVREKVRVEDLKPHEL